MVGFFTRPEVGVVGAKLLYHDGLVQHGGVWASMDQCGHFGELLPGNDSGYMDTLQYPTDCAAVTGACQMIRRDLFDQVGGLDESLAVVLNDVDLCLKADRKGIWWCSILKQCFITMNTLVEVVMNRMWIRNCVPLRSNRGSMQNGINILPVAGSLTII